MQNVLKAFSCIALGGLLFGYIIGITSNVISEGQLLCRSDLDDYTQLLQIHSDTKAANVGKRLLFSGAGHGVWTLLTARSGYDGCFDLDTWTQGFLTSSSLIGAILASLYCFRYADGMGRRREVQISAGMYFSGAVLAAGSPYLLGVFVGFLIYGLGAGFYMHVAPAYIAEIAPAQIRGTLISAKEAVIVFGILLGFLSGYAFSGYEPWGWRAMVLVSGFFALAMGLGMASIPDSPRWLELQHRKADALSALKFYREDISWDDFKDELLAIHTDIASIAVDSSWTDVFQHQRPMVIGCGLMLLQQMTGQPSLLYFSSTMFRELGFGKTSALYSVGIAVVKLVATLVSVFSVDRCGRRIMLLIGIGMMMAGLVAMTICAHSHKALSHRESTVFFTALMLYVGGYQVGFGPISWLMISEVFPLHIRGAAISVTAIVNFAANMVMTAIQPAMCEAVGLFGVFLLYSVLCAVSLGFVWSTVPETRGMTLEQISSELRPKKAT